MNFITTNYDFVLELLEDITKQDPPLPTDLIVCSSREAFLIEVVSILERHHGEHTVSTADPAREGVDQTGQATSSSRSHVLSSPSLYLLNASQYCRLVFCPSITVLRGYLSGYVSTSAMPVQPTSRVGPEGRQLIILNLLRLHHGSSEFTLQGLSQTLATAVSAAHRTHRCLQLVECKDTTDLFNPNSGPALWHAQVPLLSGSIKIGESGASWGRRTISTSKIASRWFKVQGSLHMGKAHRPGNIPHNRPNVEDEMLV
ncbi:hypothetical protein PV11_03099 [Exophiala sideris]|uniref:Uncharacterized protein n=1 Tax=Exophiala sideris TaxID=1016849 RepID=A0A0D1YYA8_9EURO|nr:hypothetical protein PV11_03099 [Exophiala sideris]